MSGQTDLDLDSILADFYREENEAPPAPAPQPARPRTETPILNSEQRAGEGTILYEGRLGRHAAPEPEPAPVPQPEEQEPPAPRPASAREGAKPAPTREKKAAPAKTRSSGRGSVPMILVLMPLGAILAGLLRWTLRAEEAAAPKEPDPLHLELGESLERSLDESAATTR